MEKLSEEFARQGSEQLKQLNQRLETELASLRTARAEVGFGVATLTEQGLQEHAARAAERPAAEVTKMKVLGKSLGMVLPGTWQCGKCHQPTRSQHKCRNMVEGCYCSGTIEAEG